MKLMKMKLINVGYYKKGGKLIAVELYKNEKVVENFSEYMQELGE